MADKFLPFRNLTTKYFIGRLCWRMARPRIIYIEPTTNKTRAVNSKTEFGVCHEAAMKWESFLDPTSKPKTEECPSHTGEEALLSKGEALPPKEPF
jgi:hypothetical protein